jgi:hypothetical protein
MSDNANIVVIAAKTRKCNSFDIALTFFSLPRRYIFIYKYGTVSIENITPNSIFFKN